ncbi:hypothetical protein [Fodinibius sp. SL11]|uniref:hypothetical protein n=1 Tax=Fodinibius sp. SL11 TaxID=3425690 RepID=UPI003F880739
MSLADVNTISSLQIDVTPNGGATSSYEYVAVDIRVLVQWKGQTWTTSDYVNHINTQARHLVFILQGSDIEQVAGGGRDASLIALDLEDEGGYTVELYPDSDQNKKFEVIAYEPGQREALRLKNMARIDEDSLKCITKQKVSRADVEWFRKYG